MPKRMKRSQHTEDIIDIYDIFVAGLFGVGKSALLCQLTSNQFVDEYDPTVGDVYRKLVVIDGETCILDISDGLYMQDYKWNERAYRQCEGFVCVFSITSRTSFEEISSYREKICRTKGMDEVPMILVGNKSDLAQDRQVAQNEAQQTAEQFGIPWMETSAKTRTNVEDAFYTLVREIRKYKQKNVEPMKTKKKTRCVVL